MGTKQKVFTVGMWGVVVVGMIGLIAMTRMRDHVRAAKPKNDITFESEPSTGPSRLILADGDEPANVDLPAPKFTLTDQAGQSFSSDQLKGKVWTAMFFFSQCKGVCPAMKGRVMHMEEIIKNPNVNFVSFTVDPERDNVDTLAKYAQEAKADPSRWHMLTGSDQQMHDAAAGLYLPYDVPATHSPYILLIDREGMIRRVYSSKVDSHMEQLARDAQKLVEEGKL